MAEKINICSICGKEYTVCPNCQGVKTYTPWRTVTDSMNCWQIYTVLSSYTNKHINKEEAKKELSQCDLSNIKSFDKDVKRAIKNIMADDKNDLKNLNDANNDISENESKTTVENSSIKISVKKSKNKKY